MKKIIIVLFFGICTVLSFAQVQNFIPGEIIVQGDRKQISSFLTQFKGDVYLEKQLSEPMSIWLIKFNPASFDTKTLLQKFKSDNRIEVAQLNHKVYLRDTLPNDTDILKQWQYVNDGTNGGVLDADLDMDQAWDITTGGVTALGDTIVVCAVDDGIDTNHIDFEDNLWVNKAEIPNNNIDDDNNGYIDDYKGWNIALQNDNIQYGSHGTPVAGIMGAKGNNNIGVSGISWNVKVMVVRSNFNTAESAVIEAYTYPLLMRQKYNNTNGAEGAFVVAVNSSWGVDQGKPSESPLWCAFYDTLGKYGIVSCGATANWDYNVDIDGDLPTACPSDYLISVTNIDRTDTKETYAGYGKTTIDLGAFGEGTYTTAMGNGYEGFGGTSGATPHVTGTVGLLYSIPCLDFAQMSKDDPQGAAALVKNAILSGVDHNASLEGISVTEGRLNTYNSLLFLMNACDSTYCFAPFGLRVDSSSSSAIKISWSSVNDTVVVYRFKNVYDSVWVYDTISNKNSLVLAELVSCREYEIQLKSMCDTSWSDFTSSFKFKTEGCGACVSADYCESYATVATTLWIDRFEIGDFVNQSGNRSGRQEFLTGELSLERNKEYNFKITPGFGGFEYAPYYALWIDYNQDALFEDTLELAYNLSEASSAEVVGTINIPIGAELGMTRLRLVQKYPSKPYSACQIFSLGEVEDYCLDIKQENSVKDDLNTFDVNIYPNPAQDMVFVEVQDKEAKGTIIVLNALGKVLSVQKFKNSQNTISLTDFSKGILFIKVEMGDKTVVEKIVKN